jgi:hypothetical protein
MQQPPPPPTDFLTTPSTPLKRICQKLEVPPPWISNYCASMKQMYTDPTEQLIMLEVGPSAQDLQSVLFILLTIFFYLSF